MMEFSYLKSIENVINDCDKWERGDGSFPRMKLPHLSPSPFTIVKSTNKWIASFISRYSFASNNGDSSGNHSHRISHCLFYGSGYWWSAMLWYMENKHSDICGENNFGHKINKSLNLRAHRLRFWLRLGLYLNTQKRKWKGNKFSAAFPSHS